MACGVPRTAAVAFKKATCASALASASKTGSITAQAGPVASTVYTTPVTSGHVAGDERPLILEPASGVSPTSPVMEELGMLVIAAEARMAKFEACPSGTVN